MCNEHVYELASRTNYFHDAARPRIHQEKLELPNTVQYQYQYPDDDDDDIHNNHMMMTMENDEADPISTSTCTPRPFDSYPVASKLLHC